MSPRGQYERPNRSESAHPKRTPIHQRNILTTDQRDGYVRRWVNDVDGRHDMFTEAGYEKVTKPTKVGDPMAGAASQVDSVVRKPVGGGVTAVLMEIPVEFYEEDQRSKEHVIRDKEKSLLSEAPQGLTGAGIKIQRPEVITE